MASDYAQQSETAAEQQPQREVRAGLKVSRSGHLADLIKGASATPQREPVAQARVKVTLPEQASDKQAFDKASSRE